MRRVACDSIEVDAAGNSLPTINYYPPAVFRKPPDWLADLSIQCVFDSDRDFLVDFIKEIYVAIHNDCRRSAVMAVRALLEQVMIDKVGDLGSFDKNMQQFQVEGFVSERQRKVLHNVIDAGHATIHRGFKPSKEDLIAVVNIAESIVEAAYINEQRASGLSKRVPPRKSKVPNKAQQADT
jgi:hypothetical protein